MKKIFVFLTFVLFSTTLSLANDILFKASKGVLSENSPSVKKLSDAEMAEVKGGYYFVRDSRYDFRGRINEYAYVLSTTNTRYNTYGYFEAARKLGFDSDRFIIAKVRWLNGAKQHFMQSYNTKTGYFSTLWVYGTLRESFYEFKRYY